MQNFRERRKASGGQNQTEQEGACRHHPSQSPNAQAPNFGGIKPKHEYPKKCNTLHPKQLQTSLRLTMWSRHQSMKATGVGLRVQSVASIQRKHRPAATFRAAGTNKAIASPSAPDRSRLLQVAGQSLTKKPPGKGKSRAKTCGCSPLNLVPGASYCADGTSPRPATVPEELQLVGKEI